MEGIRKNGMLLVFVLGTIRKTSSQLAGISISTSQNAVMPPLNSHIANDVQQPSIDSSRMLGSLSNTNDKAGEEADDAEVICQAVKEALLALRTATPSQLENQAESLGDAVPSEVSIRYKGRKLQGRKPTGTPHAHVTSCPGEFSSQQFGACMNFFFTPQCTEQSRSLVDNLFGKNQLPTAKTLVDVRDAALRIFQDAPECQVMESEAPHTCSTGLQNLKPLHFSQFIANAIPKIEQKSSASVVGATIHVSKLAKAFSHLSNAEDTVQVGNATLGNSEDKEQAGSTMNVHGSAPIVGILLALVGIGGGLFYFWREDGFNRLQHMIIRFSNLEKRGAAGKSNASNPIQEKLSRLKDRLPAARAEVAKNNSGCA